MNIIEKIHSNIRSYNKYMTDTYLQNLEVLNRLRLTHPLDRKDLAFECKKQRIITEQEYQNLLS